MARNNTISLAAEQWTQVTLDDATTVSFQNKGSSGVELMGTAGATAPTDFDGSFRCIPGGTEFGLSLSDMFPGVGSVARLWAYATDGDGSQFWISHD